MDDGEEDDDDGARTKAFTTVKKIEKMMMTMTVQERRLSWQFWHSLRRGLAFPSNAKGDLTCMDDGEEDDDDGAKKNEGFHEESPSESGRRVSECKTLGFIFQFQGP